MRPADRRSAIVLRPVLLFVLFTISTRYHFYRYVSLAGLFESFYLAHARFAIAYCWC